MRALSLFLATLCLSGAARAALTEDDAVRIGREANVQGLRALIAQRSQGLLFRATQSWNLGEARTLPEPLEALIVEYYTDPVAQRPLVGGLIARGLEDHVRFPKYRSRKLFDLLYADLKSGKDTLHYAIRIIATDLPVEPEFVALLPQLDPAAANEIVMFLGTRRYASALPALQALQARVPHDKNVNQMIERVDWAFLQIGTPEAMQALLARLRALGSSKDERAGFEVWNILLYLNQQAPGGPPDYGALRAVLPAELNDSAWDELIKLVVRRQERRGVPELVKAIAQSKRTEQAVDALLVVGGPDDWRAGRAALSVATLQKKLDDAIANPAQAAARLEERKRLEAMQRAQADYYRERNRIAALRASDPKRYAAELRALLDRQSTQATGPRQDLARDYFGLAAFLRFELRQPDEALGAYERGGRLLPPDAFDLAAMSIADLQRFDKRDAGKGLEHYRRARASAARAGAGSGQDARLAAGLKQWLDHEIAYVERGQRFSGAIGRADMGTGQLWLMLASTQATRDAPIDARLLAKLPASQLQIARAFPVVLELEPKEMLAFFAKHDPAGYLTAAILGAATVKDPSPYVKAAAETFFRERGIRGGGMSKPDPRYASPEKTWAVFIAAARKGDSAAMLDCLTPELQERFQDLFKRMSRDELRKMAESFVAFALQSGYGEFQEAMVVRQQKDRKMAGSVTFVNDGGTWKIAEM